MRSLYSVLVLAGVVFAEFGVAPNASPDLPSDASLQIDILLPANQDCTLKATNGQKVQVHYTGWSLKSGDKFDSSYDRKTPLPFTLGASQVIKGKLNEMFRFHS